MSVDRGTLRDILEALPFEAGSWVVAGSAPLLIAGLTESIEDIDIVVGPAAWQQAVASSGEEPRAGLRGDHITELEVAGVRVEIFDGWLGTTADEMIAEAVEVDGFPFSPLSRVLDSKRQLLRHKDLAHIELLEAHLGEGRIGNGR